MSTQKWVGDVSKAIGIEVDRDPIRGVRTSSVYNFTTEASANAFINGLATDQRWTKRLEPPGWTVTVQTPDLPDGSTEYDENWSYELLANHVEKDIFEHPRSKAIAEENLRRIKKADKTGNAPEAFTGLTAGEATILYGLILKGTKKFSEDEWVYRVTQTVSTRAAVVAAFSNVGKILTDAQLATLAVSGVEVPSGIGFSIAQIPVKSGDGYNWGWLKKAPTVRQTVPGKIVISYEFWLDLWSTYVYSAA